MKKLLILSGKGGTGKTTTAAAFIRFSNARAIGDCDVDAPNLHIVSGFSEDKGLKEPFTGGDKATIDRVLCTGCEKCLKMCKFDAIENVGGKCFIKEYACEGCGLCEYVCPAKAVSMKKDVAGTLSLYKEEKTFTTAKLKMGRGNSGKLVTEVKRTLDKNAEDAELAIIDGSPGIGCPVIASITGVSMVLIVAEPSLSGISDLERILKTADILDVPCAVCINKWDSSPESAEKIESLCKDKNISFVGKIPYDKRASEAVNKGKSLADFDCPARDALKVVFKNTMEILNKLS